VLSITLSPRLPYSLADSAGGSAGGTRRWRGPVLELAFRAGEAPARAWLRQRGDGRIEAALRSPAPEPAHDRLRSLLALDVDHSPFLRRAAHDPLLRELASLFPGLRPLCLGTPAHALVAAVCGQLVQAREAARMERAIVRLCGADEDGLRLPPSRADVAALAPARACAIGLAARRSAAMVRVARTVDLDGLAAHPTSAVVARLCAERNLGPWSAGVICLSGLGRYDHGLVGDLGLMRVWAGLRGRWPEPEETAELLAPYEEWAGLASVYLLRHPLARQPGPRQRFTGGRVPVSSARW
jgi:3-methyladenine DNA glycosylase/8-oxoguanine DNA glycosylase